MANVEVLLVQGERGAVDDNLWKMESIRVVLRSLSKPSRGKRGGSKKRTRFVQNAASSGVPEGYGLGIIVLEQNDVGEVTDGQFQIERDVRDRAPDVKF